MSSHADIFNSKVVNTCWVVNRNSVYLEIGKILVILGADVFVLSKVVSVSAYVMGASFEGRVPACTLYVCHRRPSCMNGLDKCETLQP